MLKYFGGRFVTPGDLKHLRAWRAASMLWVDGKVPAWVDVSVEGVYEDYSVVGVRCSTELLAFDEDKLPNDLPEYVDPGDSIKPFRTRGIAIPGIVGALPASGRIRMARIMAIRMRGTPCVETYVIVPRPED